MNHRFKRIVLVLAMMALLPLLCACHENPPQDQLYSKLFAHFESFGFTCKLQQMEPDRDVPIYKPDVWQKLLLDGEEVLVYFDDSNRADYLSGFVDETVYGHAARFGLRFVLVYSGDDARVLEALNAIENE